MMNGDGGLNNTHAARPIVEPHPDPAYAQQSLAIAPEDDDADVRARYRTFLLPPDEDFAAADWVVSKADTQFTPESGGGGRMIPSSNRDRLADCMEELVKYTVVMRPRFDVFGDRFSEREERRLKEEREREREKSRVPPGAEETL